MNDIFLKHCTILKENSRFWLKTSIISAFQITVALGPADKKRKGCGASSFRARGDPGPASGQFRIFQLLDHSWTPKDKMRWSLFLIAAFAMAVLDRWTVAAADPDAPNPSPNMEQVRAYSLIIPMNTSMQIHPGVGFNFAAYATGLHPRIRPEPFCFKILALAPAPR